MHCATTWTLNIISELLGWQLLWSFCQQRDIILVAIEFCQFTLIVLYLFRTKELYLCAFKKERNMGKTFLSYILIFLSSQNPYVTACRSSKIEMHFRSGPGCCSRRFAHRSGAAMKRARACTSQRLYGMSFILAVIGMILFIHCSFILATMVCSGGLASWPANG